MLLMMGQYSFCTPVVTFSDIIANVKHAEQQLAGDANFPPTAGNKPIFLQFVWKKDDGNITAIFPSCRKLKQAAIVWSSMPQFMHLHQKISSKYVLKCI